MKLILLGLTLQLLPLNLSIDSHTALSITELFGLVLILIGAFLQSRSDREFRRMQWLALGGVALCGASYVLAKTIGTGLVIDQSLVPGSALPRYFVVAMLGAAVLVGLEIEIVRQALLGARRMSAQIKPGADKAWKLYAITFALSKALTASMAFVTMGQPAETFAADHSLLLDTIMPFYIPALVCEMLSFVGKVWLLLRLLNVFPKQAAAQSAPKKARKRG